MDRQEWKTKIITACQEAGTYRPFFGDVINTLAAIMEIRDSAVEQYEKSGGNPVVAHTNKGGHTNIVKNPALAIINEQNQQALAYWRDLGLTTKGWVGITGNKAEKKETTFEDVLSKLEI
jgi:hypothetical protein